MTDCPFLSKISLSRLYGALSFASPMSLLATIQSAFHPNGVPAPRDTPTLSISRLLKLRPTVRLSALGPVFLEFFFCPHLHSYVHTPHTTVSMHFSSSITPIVRLLTSLHVFSSRDIVIPLPTLFFIFPNQLLGPPIRSLLLFGLSTFRHFALGL